MKQPSVPLEGLVLLQKPRRVDLPDWKRLVIVHVTTIDHKFTFLLTTKRTKFTTRLSELIPVKSRVNQTGKSQHSQEC